MYTSREPFSALTDLSWVTNHFSDITDPHVNCLHLDLDFKDMWPNLISTIWMEDEDEDVDKTVEILEQIKIRASLEARQGRLLEQLHVQESVGAPLIPVERNRKKKKKSRYQQHSRN